MNDKMSYNLELVQHFLGCMNIVFDIWKAMNFKFLPDNPAWSTPVETAMILQVQLIWLLRFNSLLPWQHHRRFSQLWWL